MPGPGGRKPKVKWTVKDKRKLLRVLQKHGSNDLSVIARHFPRVPVSSIKRLVNFYRVIADYMYEDKQLDDWLGCGLYRPGARPVAEAMKLIALFEERPEGTSEQHDFREIYEFLSKILSGEDTPIPMPSPGSLQLLFKILRKLETETWPTFQSKLFDYLSKVYKRRNIRREYQRNRAKT